MEGLNKEGAKQSQGVNLGELQEDSVQSFTDLLYMQNIDKKLITALGDFMFRISNFNHAKNQTKNQRNWSLIVQQLSNISSTSLEDLNSALLDTML
jgi:hypothetical protein